MKITAVEPFVVDGGLRPWLFLAIRTDEGITGYSEFGESYIDIPTAPGWGTELNEEAARKRAWNG